jgi:arylsulfatase A-like enzyme
MKKSACIRNWSQILLNFFRQTGFLICIATSIVIFFSCRQISNKQPGPPNIVYILADDLGYGDLSCLNENAAWKTPSIDEIATHGMIFTDAHSGSAVCTPTRYGILTGRYSWRSGLKSGVTWSWDKPIIETDRGTVASFLGSNGYTTGCIGKWHLGLGWQTQDDQPDSIDFSKSVTGGPVELGFDYFYGIAASLDIPPYVYIENDKPTTVPVKFTVSRDKFGWWRWGHTGGDFIHDQVLPHLTEKAVGFIDDHIYSESGNPFFLYFALPAPHTPILPTEEFQGTTGTNAYGDFVVQVDWTVGEVMKTLDKHGITDNTLIIVTSDNGCSPEADYDELAEFGHNPSYLFRGHKADIYEGGHRIPVVVRWPGRIKPWQHVQRSSILNYLRRSE